MAFKVPLWASITLIVVGVLLIIGGVVQYAVIPNAVRTQVIEQAVVSSENSPGYEDWQKEDEDSAGLLYSCYFWNLTNYESLLVPNSLLPKFEKIGAYTYRRRGTKFDIQFSSDEEEVTYYEYGTYTYETSLSGAGLDPENDAIVNLNPAYWGILQQAGTENGIVVAAIANAIGQIHAAATGDCGSCFLPVIAALSSPGVLSFTIDGLAQAVYYELLANDNTTTMDDAWNVLWDNFANQNTPTVSSIPPAFLLNYGRTTNLNTLPGGSFTREKIESVLFNSSYLYSLTSLEENSNKLWAYLATSDENTVLAITSQYVQPYLGLSLYQATYLVQWKLGPWDDFVRARLVDLYAPLGATVFSDVGLLHFGLPTGTLDGVSFFDLTDTLPGIPEFGVWQTRRGDTAAVLNVTQVKEIFTVLTSPLTVGAFLQQYPVFQTLTPQTLLNLGAFLQLHIVPNFIDPVFRGKIFLVSTPHEQLFGRTDAFVEFLSPGNGQISGVFSDLSQEEVREYGPPDTFKTGKSNVEDYGIRVTYNGSTVLNYFDPPLEVKGSAALDFVGPGRLDVAQPEDLSLFVTQIVRDIVLEFAEDTELKGIKTKKYRVSRQSPGLLQSTTYNNPHNYILNLEAAYGVPLYFSLPAFLEVDEALTNDLIEGVERDPVAHDIEWQFEPITGLAVRAYAPLQASLYISDNVTFGVWSKNVPAQRYYPLYYIVRSAELSDDNAETLKSKVLNTLQSSQVALIVLVILGVLFFIAGVILLILNIVSKKQKASSGDAQELELEDS